jgi:hypothetical protein
MLGVPGSSILARSAAIRQRSTAVVPQSNPAHVLRCLANSSTDGTLLDRRTGPLPPSEPESDLAATMSESAFKESLLRSGRL